MKDVVSVSLKLLTAGDLEQSLEGFDYTKLTAINTCPTWGIIRYGYHKAMPGGGRAMALEAGKAAHEAFCAIRLYQLGHAYPDHAGYHGIRCFGKARWEQMAACIQHGSSIEANTRNIALEAVATSGFTDDPYDKRRTLANLESSISAYSINQDFDRFPVWVSDSERPDARVGIEIPYEVLITYTLRSGEQLQVKYTGRIDGIHRHGEKEELLIHENKTSGRLDNAWARSFDISHQVTGYMVAGSLFTQSPITRAVIRGVQLPMPRVLVNGLQDVWQFREDYHKERWLSWVYYTVRQYYRYKDDLSNAPKFSHSCNRYFRPCSLIPYCYGTDSEQRQMIEEMEVSEWSPLAEDG